MLELTNFFFAEHVRGPSNMGDTVNVFQKIHLHFMDNKLNFSNAQFAKVSSLDDFPNNLLNFVFHTTCMWNKDWIHWYGKWLMIPENWEDVSSIIFTRKYKICNYQRYSVWAIKERLSVIKTRAVTVQCNFFKFNE